MLPPAQQKQQKSLLLFVGDVSADRHTARLLKELKSLCPDLHYFGVGGDNIRDAGCELIYHLDNFTTFGIAAPLKKYPLFARMRQELLNLIAERQPEAVMLVDFGGFNLILAQSIRARFKDLPIVYLISPQVWGSRPWRIKTIAKTVTKMLTIFPFEEALYKKHGVNAVFVGHPLIEKFKEMSELNNRQAFCSQYGFQENQPIVGIFPGSRPQEIRSHIKIVLEAAKWLNEERPAIQIALSQANNQLSNLIQEETYRLGFTHLIGDCIKLIKPEDSYQLMSAADLVWAKSGTTTLEVTLLGRPMLLFYHADWLSYLIFLMFKTVKYVGWPNLLAGFALIPELIQLDCQPRELVRYTLDWLDVPAALADKSKALQSLGSHLGIKDFAPTAAREVAQILWTKQ